MNSAGIQRFEPISRSHEGLVDILQVGSAVEYFYYIMELADDQRSAAGNGAATSPEEYEPRVLRTDFTKRGRLPPAECIQLGRNLADIGLVADMSDARSFVGTEGFIPPEGPGSPQADLYSLGKVLYEISTRPDRRDFPSLPGEYTSAPPHDSVSKPTGTAKSQYGKPISEAYAARFLELNSVITKACRADPAERYASAEAMEADLASVA